MTTATDLAAVIETTYGPLPALLRAALLEVDRTRFVRLCDRTLAYENLALPLDTPASPPAPPVSDMIATHGSWLGAALQPEYTASGATISQPAMYLMAFQYLELGPGDHYLELGTGTGYGAALAAQIVGPAGHVTSVDVDPSLVERARELVPDTHVTLLCDDALARTDLLAQHAKCWLTFSVPQLPPQLLAAVPEGGRLLAPIGPPPPAPQHYLLHRRQLGELTTEDLGFPVFFIPDRKTR